MHWYQLMWYFVPFCFFVIIIHDKIIVSLSKEDYFILWMGSKAKINNESGFYTVINSLGKGGFGEVFEVQGSFGRNEHRTETFEY